jgi:hypothetical protein
VPRAFHDWFYEIFIQIIDMEAYRNEKLFVQILIQHAHANNLLIKAGIYELTLNRQAQSILLKAMYVINIIFSLLLDV